MTTSAIFIEKSSYTFTWDVEIDTNDTSTELTMPLKTRFGEVVLEVKVQDAQHPMPCVDFGDIELGAFGGDVELSAQLHWLGEDGKSGLIESAWWLTEPSFPPRPPGSLCYEMTTCRPSKFQKAESTNSSFKRLTHRRFRFTFTAAATSPSAAAQHCIKPRDIKCNTSSSVHSKRPSNIRLFFANLDAELWDSSSFLSASSPYFKTLLAEDDFTESVRRTRKRSKIEEGQVLVLDGDLRTGSGARSTKVSEWHAGDGVGRADDSDDETDSFLKRRTPPAVEDNSNDSDFTYREIRITETPYSTYRAVLLYLHSGDIEFAPLCSTLRPLDPDGEETMEQILESHLADSPSAPFPYSPKSAYRLAHLLEIPSLCALSLAEIQHQLTIDNAARELFSTTSSLYDDLRAIVLVFVVEHWAEVKTSAGMKEMELKARTGQLPHGTAILFELLSRVSR